MSLDVLVVATKTLFLIPVLLMAMRMTGESAVRPATLVVAIASAFLTSLSDWPVASYKAFQELIGMTLNAKHLPNYQNGYLLVFLFVYVSFIAFHIFLKAKRKKFEDRFLLLIATALLCSYTLCHYVMVSMEFRAARAQQTAMVKLILRQAPEEFRMSCALNEYDCVIFSSQEKAEAHARRMDEKYSALDNVTHLRMADHKRSLNSQEVTEGMFRGVTAVSPIREYDSIFPNIVNYGYARTSGEYRFIFSQSDELRISQRIERSLFTIWFCVALVWVFGGIALMTWHGRTSANRLSKLNKINNVLL